MNYAGAGLVLLSSDLTSIVLVRDTMTGKWGFPKGHREPYDYSELETAVRECREEIGLLPEDYTICSEPFKINKGASSYIFYYATLNDDKRKTQLIHGPAYEISNVQWIPIKQLLQADHVQDGNKYLRTWIHDIKQKLNRKYVYLFGKLLARLYPSQESMSASNVVTCA